MDVLTEENIQTLKFKNYQPSINEFVEISFLNPYDDELPWYIWDSNYLEKYFICHSFTRRDIYLILVELYARRGFIFHSGREKEYFNKRNWYKPNENFTPDKFTPPEKKFIELLKIIDQNFKK
jgi:hypothetical protein